jgi:hypothetical protein
MSLNLYLADGDTEFPLEQTPTEVTERAIQTSQPLEVYTAWYKEVYLPKPLEDKDRGNPFKLALRHGDTLQALQHLSRLNDFLRTRPSAKWSWG